MDMGQHGLRFLPACSSDYHHHVAGLHDYSASNNHHLVASHNHHRGSNGNDHGAVDDDPPDIDDNDRRVRNNNWFFDVNDHRFAPKRPATCRRSATHHRIGFALVDARERRSRFGPGRWRVRSEISCAKGKVMRSR